MNASEPDEDLRVAVVFLSVRDVMTLLGNWKHGPQMCVGLLPGLPDGYRIQRVQYDFERDAIAVRVQHPSFEPIHPGMVPPALNVPGIECVVIDLAPPIGSPLGYFEPPTMTEASGNPPPPPESIKPAKKSWDFLADPRL